MAEQYADLAFLTSRVPELKCITDANALTAALLDAQGFVELRVYGVRADLAHAFYAAHLLACRFPDELGGEQGPVESLSANEISASFGTQELSEARPNTTKWGRQFEQICNATVPCYVVG